MNSPCPVEGSQTLPWPAHSLLGLRPCWCREISKLINPQKITSPIHWSMITVLMKKPIEDSEFSPQWMGACVCVWWWGELFLYLCVARWIFGVILMLLVHIVYICLSLSESRLYSVLVIDTCTSRFWSFVLRTATRSGHGSHMTYPLIIET